MIKIKAIPVTDWYRKELSKTFSIGVRDVLYTVTFFGFIIRSVNLRELSPEAIKKIFGEKIASELSSRPKRK